MKRLLLVKLRSLGDVVLGARVFAAVRKAYPRSRISLLVSPPAHELLKFSGWADEVFAYSKAAVDRLGFLDRARKETRLVEALRKRAFDVAVDFYGSHRSAHLTTNANAGLTAGLDMPETAGFYDVRASGEGRLTQSAAEMDRRVAALLGVEALPEVLWPVPPSALEVADALFEGAGWTGEDWKIALNPFASCPSKEWPLENWARLASSLLDKGLKPFFTCAPLETGRLAPLQKALPQPLPVYSDAALTPLLGLYRRSKAMVSSDSGPRHVAAAVGTPTVTVWGPELPSRWHPYDRAKHPLAMKEVTCRPCGLSVCVERKHECLRTLEVKDVEAALKSVLKTLA